MIRPAGKAGRVRGAGPSAHEGQELHGAAPLLDPGSPPGFPLLSTPLELAVATPQPAFFLAAGVAAVTAAAAAGVAAVCAASAAFPAVVGPVQGGERRQG